MCLTPFFKKSGEGPFPCGKCPECRLRRASDWGFRLMEEDKKSTSSLFITLTYDTKFVHRSKNGFLTLDKRDVQLFFKRLRKAHSESSCKIRYYAVGEYGGRSRRPHYHVIAFGADISKVQPAWQLGAVHYGTVSLASVCYTLKYITKSRTVPRHKNDDRLPEFSLMSKDWGSHTLPINVLDGIRQISQDESTAFSPEVLKSGCRGTTVIEFMTLLNADFSKENLSASTWKRIWS